MKISIITINLNNLKGLKETFESVMEQTFKDFEYLVIDGGSTDGAKEFIEQHAENLHFWQSKKDRGIYDAMNIGIQKSTGEYLFFLNSGDVFHDKDLLQSISSLMVEDIVYGDIEEIDGNHISLLKNSSKIDFEHLIKFGLSHQSSFIKRDLFLKHGLYNANLKICADWTFFVDVICKYSATYQYIPVTVSRFNKEGISSLRENLHIIKKEKEYHLATYYSPFISYYRSTELMAAKHNALKNSRMIKLLSILFKQLKF